MKNKEMNVIRKKTNLNISKGRLSEEFLRNYEPKEINWSDMIVCNIKKS